jgi:biotin carboxyl carrier protein
MTEHKTPEAPEAEETGKEISGLDAFLLDDFVYETNLTKKFRNRKPYEPADPKKIFAFIPGKIKKLNIKKKSKVKEGEILLVLEAMKMNNLIFSPMKGTIKEVHVSVGSSVSKGTLLIEFK